ncbi:hypothetical protein BDV93DRAFT_288206 [Ceratobasidium sp. AG-I]|nr:hypothetical protein BDV93DRAFT_288206 [Ceratobasidium sp. AG-I]
MRPNAYHMKNICLQCYRLPQQPGLNFCSNSCLKNAPRLLEVPRHHDMYVNVEEQFRTSWEDDDTIPTLEAIYLVQETREIRAAFKRYREKIEGPKRFRGRRDKLGQPMLEGNEKLLFRGVARACDVGEIGQTETCEHPSCNLCDALDSGFGPYLQTMKENSTGAKLGHGIYTCRSSSVAASYARNTGLAGNSLVRVLTMCRVVVGRPSDTEIPHNFINPPYGYDSVCGIPGANSVFKSPEFAVYDADAICVAYLIVFSTNTTRSVDR